MTERLLALAVVTLFAATTHADVFFTGRIDMNAGGVTGPGDPLPQSNRSRHTDGGASFNNVFGTGASGASQAGDAIRSVGATLLVGGQAGNTLLDFGSGQSLVAVFALAGRIADPGPSGAKSNFQTELGGQGVVFIMDRTGAPAFTNNDPSTWVQNINDLSQGKLAELRISDLPTAVGAGLPGPPTTQVPAIGNIANLNTATIDLDLSFAISTPQLKLDITNLGTFFANPDVAPPAGDPNTVLTNLAALLQINQTLDSLTQPSLGLNGAEIEELNAIFNQLIGGQFATGLGSNGSDYNPGLPGGVNTGDAALFNTGGFGIPGGQFAPPQTEIVPEPASIAVWGLILAVGACFGFVRQRRRVA